MDHLGFALRNAWLVPALPFFSFIVVGLLIRPLSKKAAGLVATAAVFAAAAMAGAVAWEYFHLYPPATEHPAIIPWSFQWLSYQPGLAVNAGVLVDPISVLLMVVVTVVSALVHLYSIGYMHGDEGYGRYFTFLNLFTFSMFGLVVAPNLVQMYVCWELVGVSSFLLIGFYYRRPSAVAAAKKAFIVTRFADLGFLIGILILGFYGYGLFDELSRTVAPQVAANGVSNLQAFDFLYLTHPAVLARLADPGLSILGIGVLTLAMILVFMGAAGKSAMFPFHIWLPDAMEGPTPVSALIHAATMVVAGVYLVARLMPAFVASPAALNVVLYVGTFTCLFAAIIATTQNDIKRVLAFSTLSQLGYMMLALGADDHGRAAGLHREHVPPVHARLLQGVPVPGGRRGHSCRADQRNLEDGRAGPADADHARHLRRRDAGHRRHLAAVGVLLQGRDPDGGPPDGALRRLRGGGRRRRPDGLLHAPHLLRRFSGPVPERAGRACPRTVAGDVGAPGHPGRPERRGGLRAHGPVRGHGPAGRRVRRRTGRRRPRHPRRRGRHPPGVVLLRRPHRPVGPRRHGHGRLLPRRQAEVLRRRSVPVRHAPDHLPGSWPPPSPGSTATSSTAA